VLTILFAIAVSGRGDMDTQSPELFNHLPDKLRIASLHRYYEGFNQDVHVDVVDAATQQYSVRSTRALSPFERFLFALSSLGPPVAGIVVFAWLVPTSTAGSLIMTLIVTISLAIGLWIWWKVRTVRLHLTNTSANGDVMELREPDRTKLMSTSLGSVVALLLLMIYAGTVAFMSAVIVPCILQGPQPNQQAAGVSFVTFNCDNYVMPANPAGATTQPGSTLTASTYQLKPAIRENLKTIFNIQSIVYGLVSALVVATLAATRPGDVPTGMAGQSLSGNAQRVSQIISSLYVAIWMACGTAALFVGVFQYPSIDQVHLSSALSTLGLTWVGLAVAASYAYFGINRERAN
jgi:hypothetical protein